jgi:hypothetical protein
MSIEENKAVVGRWFTEFWGKDFNPAVVDELAAPGIRFEYSLHAPLRGRDAVRASRGRWSWRVVQDKRKRVPLARPDHGYSVPHRDR